MLVWWLSLLYNSYKDIVNFYDRVRKLSGFKEEKLPNEVIDYYENAPIQEQELLIMVKDVDLLPEAKRPIFESALIYKTAIAILNSYGGTPADDGNIKVAQTTNLKIEYFENGTRSILTNLYIKLNELLKALLGEDYSTDCVRFQITQ